MWAYTCSVGFQGLIHICGVGSKPLLKLVSLKTMPHFSFTIFNLDLSKVQKVVITPFSAILRMKWNNCLLKILMHTIITKFFIYKWCFQHPASIIMFLKRPTVYITSYFIASSLDISIQSWLFKRVCLGGGGGIVCIYLVY